jgi:hypothetical protein
MTPTRPVAPLPLHYTTGGGFRVTDEGAGLPDEEASGGKQPHTQKEEGCAQNGGLSKLGHARADEPLNLRLSWRQFRHNFTYRKTRKFRF